MPEPNTVHIERRFAVLQTNHSKAPTRFLSLRQVLERTSISRSLVYQLIKDEERPFPAPVHIGRRSVWIEGEVEAYMQDIVKAARRLDERRSVTA
ncbi:AlpA family phage regulatory protein [Hyphomonas sp.]|uniref:helix-turn-helix transcriptional regulator n=1 Tax=Hyphomonas sp. TaxID=87 RepID=UPI0025C4F5BE|nr:AlpA family phage regulatory protein [Hyphomonas sp.]